MRWVKTILQCQQKKNKELRWATWKVLKHLNFLSLSRWGGKDKRGWNGHFAFLPKVEGIVKERWGKEIIGATRYSSTFLHISYQIIIVPFILSHFIK